MGIRKIIAIVGLTFAVATTQAATNSWTYTGANQTSYHWDATGSWSLNAAPTITDNMDLITNATSKTVVINASDAALLPAELTISNLTVAGTGNTTNNLSLLNMNAGALVPLHVVGTLVVGTGATLQITNSMLRVDSLFSVSGTTLFNNLSTVQASNATFSSTAVIQFALGTTTNTVVVSKDLTLGGTINITNGGGLTNATYTLFTYGGIFTSNALAIGTTPTNFTCAIDSSSVAGKVNLIVSQSQSSSSTGTFQIVSIARSTDDIVIQWTAANTGNNAVQAENGDCNTNNFSDLSGTIPVSAGVTNSYTDLGGATNAPSRFYRIRAF